MRIKTCPRARAAGVSENLQSAGVYMNEEAGKLLVSSGSAEESEEGECSSGDEENSSSLPQPAKQVLVHEEIDSEEETSEEEKEREIESGDKINPEKLMQLGSSSLDCSIYIKRLSTGKPSRFQLARISHLAQIYTPVILTCSSIILSNLI